MIPYHLANHTLKSALDSFLKDFLSELKAAEHFAIELTSQSTLMIRGRTRENCPTLSERRNLIDLLTHLKNYTLLEFTAGTMLTNFGMVSTLTITHIDPSLEFSLGTKTERETLIKQFSATTPSYPMTPQAVTPPPYQIGGIPAQPMPYSAPPSSQASRNQRDLEDFLRSNGWEKLRAC